MGIEHLTPAAGILLLLVEMECVVAVGQLCICCPTLKMYTSRVRGAGINIVSTAN